MRKNFTVRIDEKIRTQIRQLAYQKRVSINLLVETYLISQINKEKK
jgi:predicted HicB family RNase H-like nuclease